MRKNGKQYGKRCHYRVSISEKEKNISPKQVRSMVAAKMMAPPLGENYNKRDLKEFGTITVVGYPGTRIPRARENEMKQIAQPDTIHVLGPRRRSRHELPAITTTTARAKMKNR